LKETTYTVFEKEMHIVIKEAKHVIRSVELDKEAAQALDMKKGEACLTMDRITYSDQGAVLELMTFFYPTDSFQFEINLPRHEKGIALKMSEG
jgi:GntR family transcriptional regulator